MLPVISRINPLVILVKYQINIQQPPLLQLFIFIVPIASHVLEIVQSGRDSHAVTTPRLDRPGVVFLLSIPVKEVP